VQSGRQLPTSGRNTTIALTVEVKVNQLKRVALYVHEMGWRGEMGHGRQRPITIRWGRENMP
jgi:hypothetical protein